MDLFWIVYCVSSLFGVYTIYKLMSTSYGTARVSRKIEFISYVLYYIADLIVYLGFMTPWMNLLKSFLSLFLLSYLYKATFRKRMLLTVLLLFLLLSIETIVALAITDINVTMHHTEYMDWSAYVIRDLITFLVAYVIENFFNLKRNIKVPALYWVLIFMVPLSSSYFTIVFLSSKDITYINTIVFISLLLIVNFAILYVYNAISNNLMDRTEKLLYEQQYKSYKQQFVLMQSAIKTNRSITHDMKNHLFSIKALIESRDEEKATEYLNNILVQMAPKGQVANTGNLLLDSILNYKFQEAFEQDIRVSANIRVPKELNISEFDMTIILGNLMDNAIHAAKSREEDRFIDVKIKYDKGRLLIRIENSYNEALKYENNKLVTSQSDHFVHGIGLNNVETALKNYHGELDIKATDNVFRIYIIMYITE